VKFLLRAPRLLSPVFCINSVRLFREMVAAKGGVTAALPFALGHIGTVIRHPFSPAIMARRITMLGRCSLEAEVARVRAPALVLTGEATLDRVVPVSLTREYLRLWPQATAATIERSGHLGTISRPEEFADLIARFAEANARHHDQRRRSVG
jgi:pimeloyl-ACP methyl ester carboxylesterase